MQDQIYNKLKYFGFLMKSHNERRLVLVRIIENCKWDFSLSGEALIDLLSDTLGSESAKIIGEEALIDAGLRCEITMVNYAEKRAFYCAVQVQSSVSAPEGYQFVDIAHLQAGTCVEPKLFSTIDRDHIVPRLGYQVLVCVDALVFRAHETSVELLLMEKIQPKSGEKVWEYPKGGIRFLETPIEGALRELREETGTNLYKVAYQLGSQNVDVRDRGREYQIIEVSGIAVEFVGTDIDIQPEKREGFTGRFEWLSPKDACSRIWLKGYGVEFIRRLTEKLMDAN